MAVTLRGPEYLISPLLPNGQANPFFGLVAYLPVRALDPEANIQVRVANGLATITGITDTRMLTWDVIESLVTAGVEILGLPVFIKIPEADAGDNVPSYLPNAVDGEATPFIWSNWHDSSHESYLIDGFLYVPGNAWGDELSGAVIKQLMDDEFVLMTLAERQEVAADEVQP